MGVALAGTMVLAVAAVAMLEASLHWVSTGPPMCDGELMKLGDSCIVTYGSNTTTLTYGQLTAPKVGVPGLWWASVPTVIWAGGLAVHTTERADRTVQRLVQGLLAALGVYLLVVHAIPAGPTRFPALLALALLVRAAVVTTNDVVSRPWSGRLEVSSRYLVGLAGGIALLPLVVLMVETEAGRDYPAFARWLHLPTTDGQLTAALVITCVVALFCLQDGWRGTEQERALDPALLSGRVRGAARVLLAVAAVVTVAGAVRIIATGAVGDTTAFLLCGFGLFVFCLLGTTAGDLRRGR